MNEEQKKKENGDSKGVKSKLEKKLKELDVNKKEQNKV